MNKILFDKKNMSKDTKSQKSIFNARQQHIKADLSILLVDDDSIDVLFIKQLLEKSFQDTTIQIDSAANFSEAIEKLHANEYDIGLFDFRIGHLNGLDLLANLKANDVSMPVVLVTGQGDEETAVKALKSGAKDYLVKENLSAKLLLETITKHVAKLKPSLTGKIKSKFVEIKKGRTLDYKLFQHIDNLVDHIVQKLD